MPAMHCFVRITIEPLQQCHSQDSCQVEYPIYNPIKPRKWCQEQDKTISCILKDT